MKVIGEISKAGIGLIVRYRNNKGNGNLPKDPNSLSVRLEKTKGRPSPENLDKQYGDLKEGSTPAETDVADLGSVNGRALGFLYTVASEYDVE